VGTDARRYSMAPTPEERKRAGLAVDARISGLHTNAAAIARRAGIDPKTLRALLAGESWPTAATRARICEALDWPIGELSRRALDGGGLETYTTRDLLVEVWRRVEQAGI